MTNSRKVTDMMTLTMVPVLIPTLPDVVSIPSITNRSVVRVIWGRGMGSTYQRYQPASKLTPQAVEVGPSSVFSRPLDCPGCGGALELRQPDATEPDRLIGSCARCGISALLEVGLEGRITVINSTGPEKDN